MKKEIYEVYCGSHDITTIFEDSLKHDEVVSTEVKGFYFGEPEESATKQFYGSLKSNFDPSI